MTVQICTVDKGQSQKLWPKVKKKRTHSEHYTKQKIRENKE